MQHNDIDSLEVQLKNLEEHTEELLIPVRGLVSSINDKALRMAKDDFRAFFDAFGAGAFRIWETDDFIKARHEEVVISMKKGKAEDRLLSVLDVIEFRLYDKVTLLQILDTSTLPQNDGHIIVYRYTKPESLLNWYIEREKRTQVWLSQICESEQTIGYAQISKFLISSYFNVTTDFKSHIKSVLRQ